MISFTLPVTNSTGEKSRKRHSLCVTDGGKVAQKEIMFKSHQMSGERICVPLCSLIFKGRGHSRSKLGGGLDTI
jgi:hypothetical protein